MYQNTLATDYDRDLEGLILVYTVLLMGLYVFDFYRAYLLAAGTAH